ncbi:hypothetical protein DFP73DRAFT_539627, partial [Morchella snyderi]
MRASFRLLFISLACTYSSCSPKTGLQTQRHVIYKTQPTPQETPAPLPQLTRPHPPRPQSPQSPSSASSLPAHPQHPHPHPESLRLRSRTRPAQQGSLHPHLAPELHARP